MHTSNKYTNDLGNNNELMIAEDGERIHQDVVFGNAHIYVPADWIVLTNVDTVFGDVSFHGAGSTNGADTLLVNGDVVFGELNIHYV